MADSEDHTALAAEYALGTLDAEERAQVEALISADADFAAVVEAWKLKLAPLNQMVGSVEPRAEVWDRIKAAIGMSEAPIAATAAAASPSMPPASSPNEAAPVAEPGLSPESMRVVRFAKQTYVWKRVAGLSMAVAASLLAIIGVQLYQPDLLPDPLRPAVRTRTVEVQAPPAATPAQFVAVLQKDGSSPAFILTVDAATRNFTVRRVAAPPEPGRSYELWLVSDKLQKPRSLGVIGSKEFVTRPELSAYDSAIVNQATYAVTIEPEGGSPTGVATGPIVYTGKLIENVPTAPR
ncbi:MULTISPECIES: anti-sigma factor [Rhodopseudomonas]|uniref:Regulator of SigK n=1 Tax=Rhodopseudomonas palustris TaxID=1076 RepID=A0A0D7EFZ1_RHOPL|nr:MULTISPECIES: anti-sigma factor [Rhodopseudomonas]KIZ39699.1 anti-sigma K factor Rska [Rhodopseudomonas palustris]MDF3813158.1 anti-sigma factor [Rhodopseudomonas sp. BAL398]WOK17881.1 anti-sigma factor [Rhodopseudomonas sp. BAL398]